MTASPAPAVQELRALLVLAELPPGCIAVPVVKADLAPHLRAGEFAIVDTADCEPVHGELFLVAWMGALDPDGRERTALCQAYHRHGGWSVGSMLVPRTRAEVEAMCRNGRIGELGWSNGPYCDGVLEEQIRGRVVGVLAPTFEEPRRLPPAPGGASCAR